MSLSFSAYSASSLSEVFDTTGFDVARFAAGALRDRNSLAAAIDFTLLSPTASAVDIRSACERAAHYSFACVTVNPCWIALARSVLAGTGIVVGSVIGFPLGASLTHSKRDEAESALRLGARELEMVMNLGALRSRNLAAVHSDLQAVAELAHDGGALLTAVLETCLLTVEEKLRAAEICLAGGADFLQTSTGFSSGGATVQDVSLLRGVVGGRCGVKASEAINTLLDARLFLEAGASRICTSCAVEVLEELAPSVEQGLHPAKRG